MGAIECEVLFIINQVLKGEANEEERKVATQLSGPLMPIQQSAPKSVARVITEEEKDFKAYQYLRGVRYITYKALSLIFLLK